MPAADGHSRHTWRARLTTRPARPTPSSRRLRRRSSSHTRGQARPRRRGRWPRRSVPRSRSTAAVARSRPLGCLMLGLDTIPDLRRRRRCRWRAASPRRRRRRADRKGALLITKLRKAATFPTQSRGAPPRAANAQADRSAMAVCRSASLLRGHLWKPCGIWSASSVPSSLFWPKDMVWLLFRMALWGGTNGATVRPTPAGPRMAPWLFPSLSVFGRSTHAAGVVTLRRTFRSSAPNAVTWADGHHVAGRDWLGFGLARQSP